MSNSSGKGYYCWLLLGDAVERDTEKDKRVFICWLPACLLR